MTRFASDSQRVYLDGTMETVGGMRATIARLRRRIDSLLQAEDEDLTAALEKAHDGRMIEIALRAGIAKHLHEWGGEDGCVEGLRQLVCMPQEALAAIGMRILKESAPCDED